MLTNALEVQALRESLRNQAIRDVVKDIDAWHETQLEAMITDLVNCITSPDPDLDSLARNIGNLDPHIVNWVTSIHAPLRKAAAKLVTQEAIEDCIVPHAKELLESEWMRCQTKIEQEIRTHSNQYEAELCHSAEAYAQHLEHELREQAEQTITDLKAKLEDKLADDITQLKNHAKVSLQAARDEAESHSLTLTVCMPKAAKPSPLSITHPKKTKKKKSAILDLTTPPPNNEIPPSGDTDMETETDSTPTTPVCRSSTPSPAPLPTIAPETVNTDVADPNSIPCWAQTSDHCRIHGLEQQEPGSLGTPGLRGPTTRLGYGGLSGRERCLRSRPVESASCLPHSPCAFCCRETDAAPGGQQGVP